MTNASDALLGTRLALVREAICLPHKNDELSIFIDHKMEVHYSGSPRDARGLNIYEQMLDAGFSRANVLNFTQLLSTIRMQTVSPEPKIVTAQMYAAMFDTYRSLCDFPPERIRPLDRSYHDNADVRFKRLDGSRSPIPNFISANLQYILSLYLVPPLSEHRVESVEAVRSIMKDAATEVVLLHEKKLETMSENEILVLCADCIEDQVEMRVG